MSKSPENRGRNVLIFGATGMVGSEVLAQCLAEESIDTVLTIGRRTAGVQHAKLREIEHDDFLDFSTLDTELSRMDLCIYCLGVYQAQVSKDQFWEITVAYLSALIDAFERSNRAVRFCLFSAQGASTSEKSPFRFAKAKGRAENILMASALSETHAFRPGFIMPGPSRKNATLSARLFEPIYRLFPGIGIDAPRLARVMIDVGIKGHDKVIFENRDLRAHSGA